MSLDAVDYYDVEPMRAARTRDGRAVSFPFVGPERGALSADRARALDGAVPMASTKYRRGYGSEVTLEALAKDPYGVALHAKFSDGLAGALIEARARAERSDVVDQRRTYRAPRYDPTKDADGHDAPVASARGRGLGLQGPRGPVFAQLTTRSQRARAGRALGVGPGSFTAPMPTLTPRSLADAELYAPSAALIEVPHHHRHGFGHDEEEGEATKSLSFAPSSPSMFSPASSPFAPPIMLEAAAAPGLASSSASLKASLARFEAAALATFGDPSPMTPLMAPPTRMASPSMSAAPAAPTVDPRYFPGMLAASSDASRVMPALGDATGRTMLHRLSTHNDTRATHVARLGEAYGVGDPRTGPAALGHTDRFGFRMPPHRARAMLAEAVAPRVFPSHSEFTDALLMERALQYKPDYRADTAERAMIAGAEFPEPINVRNAVMAEAAAELADYNRDPHVRRIR